MRYKNDKNISNSSSPDSFFKLKMHQNPFSARTPLGELTTLPRPPSRLGRGIPPPHSPPRSTAPFSGPLNTKSWLRQCFSYGNFVTVSHSNCLHCSLHCRFTPAGSFRTSFVLVNHLHNTQKSMPMGHFMCKHHCYSSSKHQLYTCIYVSS